MSDVKRIAFAREFFKLVGRSRNQSSLSCDIELGQFVAANYTQFVEMIANRAETPKMQKNLTKLAEKYIKPSAGIMPFALMAPADAESEGE